MGNKLGRQYHGNVFYYILNLQGDVVRIVNSAGVVRAEYTYNAWGELLSASGPVCNLNPLRYRGYVYDVETGLYYLNSRYYDPANRRFVNADTADVLAIEQGSFVQYNLFAYCLNNPIRNSDSEGNLGIIATCAIAGGITGAIWGGISSAMSGEDVVQGALIGLGSGAINGALSGMMVCSRLPSGISTALSMLYGASSNVLAYVGTHKDNYNLYGVVGAAVAGGLAGLWSPAKEFGLLGNGVGTYLTTGISNIATGIAHAVGQSENQRSSKQIHYSRLKPSRTVRTRNCKRYAYSSKQSSTRYRSYAISCSY